MRGGVGSGWVGEEEEERKGRKQEKRETYGCTDAGKEQREESTFIDRETTS